MPVLQFYRRFKILCRREWFSSLIVLHSLFLFQCYVNANLRSGPQNQQYGRRQHVGPSCSVRFLVYFQELESFNYMKDLLECTVRAPQSFSPLLFHRNARADTICVCVRTVDKAAVLCLDFTRPESWVALHSSHYEGSLSVYSIACYKTSPDLPAVIIAKYKGLFRLHLERSFNQFIHWNLNLGGIIFAVRPGP